ncbi:carbon-phosphorus lyase complex subunit PhnI [Paenibacillus sp. GCM10023250]|uniref:carbon-phosphorus lyase complex subunit PhnI n=1 Tax=Paenibacillus sp. GCM10023250 TaxID=3252648 RepID=UPI00360C7C0B
MAYVAVTGGREAIEQASELNHYYRLKDAEDILPLGAVEKQLRLLIDKVMGEAGLYAPEYAALALKQAEGDPAEAVFLLRAYRSTLARNHVSRVTDTSSMRVIRRISSSFRDLPGGQVLGPTYDYTHRLLHFGLRREGAQDARAFLDRFLQAERRELTEEPEFRKVADLLREQGLMPPLRAARDTEPFDVTRRKVILPASRSARLQMLARGETGAMTALAYSSMRGYGAVHPTIGELRVGYAEVTIDHPYGAGDDPEDRLYLGELLATEVETINSFKQDASSGEVHFVMGYGLVTGQNELKAISMAILERSLDTEGTAPAQDEEFVLTHIDGLESTGFVSHLKLPHYITFQSSLDRIRQAQREKERVAKERKEEYEDGQQQQQPAGAAPGIS